MSQAERRPAGRLTARMAVIGGGGFVGGSLANALFEQGYGVIAMDLRRGARLSGSVSFVEGDVRNTDDVRLACRGCACVFQIASYGMSGREMLDKQRINEVNVKGTKNVLDACIQENVPCLIYTSSYNAVFVGQTIINGTESLPYPSDNQFVDDYSRSKTVAERLVLAANGTILADGSQLRTCAIRPAGIYGRGEERHTPRILEMYRQGLVPVAFGLESKQDWAGEVYCIADEEPVNTILFFKPLVEGLGYTFPRFTVPVFLVYYFAFLVECVHSILSPIYNFQPLMTRAEVEKTTVTHYFSMDKARRDLRYSPIKHTPDEVIEEFRENGWTKPSAVLRFSWKIVLSVACLIVAILLFQNM